MGVASIPIIGERLEVICYPVCNLRCRNAMPGYRFAEDFINPDSDAFRSQFPTLHCNLMVAGHYESSYTQTVGTSYIMDVINGLRSSQCLEYQISARKH